MSIQNRPAYFAKRLNEAMKGAGTNNKTLIRVLVSRCEVDLVNIKEEYASLFGKSLADHVTVSI